jgi:5-methyltetrahydrofolate--homocysteine methyltransferase
VLLDDNGGNDTMHQLLEKVFAGVLEGNRVQAREGVIAALEAGLTPAEILNDAMIAAMAEVGRRFEQGDYYVPELLIAARAMQECLALLKPRLAQANVKPAGRVVLGTVRGDLHDIGKNLVAMMLEGAGFEVIDLGTDVAPERFVDAVREKRPDLLALSALLTTTMPSMRVTIQALETAGVRAGVKVIVGGAPLTAEFAEQISADGFAPDASRAVTLAKSLVTPS